MMVDTEHCIIMVILGVFSIVGTIGNFLVLYIYTKKRDRTTSNIFILTLAGTDFLTCLVLIPFNIVAIGLDHRLEIDFFCKMYMFLLTCNVPFSAFIMVAIAFDRYFCICHPFLHAINIPRAKAIVFLMVALACVFGILTSLMYSTFRSPLSDATKGSNITCLQTAPSSDQPYNTSFTSADLCGEASITPNDTDAEGEDLEGVCGPFNDIFGPYFIWVYQKIYAGFYLLSFLIVFVLYGLIYRAIHLRRALKAKRKRSSLFPAAAEISMAETQMTALNGNNIDNSESSDKCLKKKHTGQMKDKNFYANIRTAAMLFIVTVVFLLAFLPAWLMAYGWIPYSPIVFYMYFLYNVANPVIYAFMNMSFRADLRSLLCSRI